MNSPRILNRYYRYNSSSVTPPRRLLQRRHHRKGLQSSLIGLTGGSGDGVLDHGEKTLVFIAGINSFRLDAHFIFKGRDIHHDTNHARGKVSLRLTLPPSPRRESRSNSPIIGGKWVVLYFYPKDNTPGCTKEACSLRDNQQAINAVNAVVLGVSLDSAESHQKFRQKFKRYPSHCSPIPTPRFPEHTGYMAKRRVAEKLPSASSARPFLIDPAGIIRKVFAKVDVNNHGREVLKAISEQ